MALNITSLNSGSNGNCYYVGNAHEAVLIDAGISCREIEKRMNRLGLAIKKLKAVFISHVHTDHISGLTVLSKKYDLPVYITPLTLQNSGLPLDADRVRLFSANEAVNIGQLSVTAFAKRHDAVEPHSFVVEYQNIKIGVFTDIGSVCEQLTQHFSGCHAAFLEANYDDELLENGNYPFHLKRRIKSDHGHLSNLKALELFINHKPAWMSHLLLAHLSKDNNNPQLVAQLFQKHAGTVNITVASRYEETPVFQISGAAMANGNTRRAKVQAKVVQYSLF